MLRRGLIVNALAAVIASDAAGAGHVALIYVGGWDCGPCLAWKRNRKPEWIASEEYTKVRYIEIESPRLKEAYEPRYWPREWHWVLDQLPQKRGTPRFLVVKDRTVIANHFGTGKWQDVLEAVRRNA